MLRAIETADGATLRTSASTITAIMFAARFLAACNGFACVRDET